MSRFIADGDLLLLQREGQTLKLTGENFNNHLFHYLYGSDGQSSPFILTTGGTIDGDLSIRGGNLNFQPVTDVSDVGVDAPGRWNHIVSNRLTDIDGNVINESPDNHPFGIKLDLTPGRTAYNQFQIISNNADDADGNSVEPSSILNINGGDDPKFEFKRDVLIEGIRTPDESDKVSCAVNKGYVDEVNVRVENNLTSIENINQSIANLKINAVGTDFKYCTVESVGSSPERGCFYGVDVDENITYNLSNITTIIVSEFDGFDVPYPWAPLGTGDFIELFDATLDTDVYAFFKLIGNSFYYKSGYYIFNVEFVTGNGTTVEGNNVKIRSSKGGAIGIQEAERLFVNRQGDDVSGKLVINDLAREGTHSIEILGYAPGSEVKSSIFNVKDTNNGTEVCYYGSSDSAYSITNKYYVTKSIDDAPYLPITGGNLSGDVVIGNLINSSVVDGVKIGADGDVTIYGLGALNFHSELEGQVQYKGVDKIIIKDNVTVTTDLSLMGPDNSIFNKVTNMQRGTEPNDAVTLAQLEERFDPAGQIMTGNLTFMSADVETVVISPEGTIIVNSDITEDSNKKSVITKEYVDDINTSLSDRVDSLETTGEGLATKTYVDEADTALSTRIDSLEDVYVEDFVSKSGDSIDGELYLTEENKLRTRYVDSGEDTTLKLQHNHNTKVSIGDSVIIFEERIQLNKEATEFDHAVTKKYVDDRLKGIVGTYVLKDVGNNQVSGSGHFGISTSFYKSVKQLNFGPTDLSGTVTQVMANNDIIEFFDPPNNVNNRYKVTDASNAPSAVKVEFISGNASFARDESYQVQIYPASGGGGGGSSPIQVLSGNPSSPKVGDAWFNTNQNTFIIKVS